ncbi:hypothetical protein Bbelb_368150 [Branchiostoma belcheri]|nr:hypothetical protein Bbelb_368150 [Branchiostoma belcheri]
MANWWVSDREKGEGQCSETVSSQPCSRPTPTMVEEEFGQCSRSREATYTFVNRSTDGPMRRAQPTVYNTSPIYGQGPLSRFIKSPSRSQSDRTFAAADKF